MKTIVWMNKLMAEAETMIFNGDVEGGVNVLNGLLYDEPGYGILHNYLGWANMYYVRDMAKAELHFAMAMRFAPDYAPPYLHMGNLMNQTGRYADALLYFQKGLQQPNALRSALMEGIGLAYELTGKYSEAIRAYKEAARGSAGDFEIDRFMNGVKRCRRKRVAFFFSF
jgi:tetratricopeptide (TPR) repeat protein